MKNACYNRLSYFPELYPDELLYSVAARYGRHAGGLSSRSINGSLFRQLNSVAPYDLPTGIGYLCSVLPKKRSISANTIIYNHTILPFYVAFISRERRARIEAAMLLPSTQGTGTFARRKSHVGHLSKFRFCPQCQIEMVNRFGEAYWKRSHQLPLAVTCPDHKIILHESNIVIGDQLTSYTIADKASCPQNSQPVIPEVSIKLLDHLCRLTTLSTSYLLNTPTSVQSKNISQNHKNGLQKIGLSKSKAKLDIAPIRTKAIEYFREVMEVWPKLELPNKIDNSWLLLPTKALNHECHPVYHILLEDFIRNQPKGEEISKPKYFWEDKTLKWECFNPIAHRASKAQVIVEVHYDYETYSSARFRCTCGYVYTRRKFMDGSLSKPRLRSFGPTLIPVLREAEAGNWSADRTGRAVGLTGQGVIVEAAKLGFHFSPKRYRRTGGAT